MANQRPFVRGLTRLLPLFLLASCHGGPTAPAASHGLLLAVHVGPPNIGVSRSYPVFSAELINVSAEDITLVFPTTCTVLLYIDDLRGNNVYPGYGAWGCGERITRVTLAPGFVSSRSVELRSGAMPAIGGSSVTLPPGNYIAYAEVEGAIGELGGQRVELRARSVSFRVP